MIWHSEFGEPGRIPESYWRPDLAHWFHLRPCDIGDLTPAQLFACVESLPDDTT